MAFPVEESRIRAAEEALGRTFPDVLRQRLMLENGGEIDDADEGLLVPLSGIRRFRPSPSRTFGESRGQGNRNVAFPGRRISEGSHRRRRGSGGKRDCSPAWR